MATIASGSVQRIAKSAAFLFFSLFGPAYAAETWIFSTELKAPTPAANDEFGTSVAMDGNYIVVGSPYRTFDMVTKVGLVYVYHNSGGKWTFLQTLSDPAGSANEHFGASVAIHGNDIIVGSPDAFVTGANSGSITIFAFNPTSGHFEFALDLGASDANQYMGAAVAMGPGYALGALAGPASGAQISGQVYSWPKGTTGWTNGPSPVTPTTEQAHQRFGASVAASALVGSDATQRMVVGSPSFTVAEFANSGLVYVFEGDGYSWRQTQLLFESGVTAGDEFGAAVAISNDYVFGSSVVRDKPGGPAAAGSVTAYRWSGTAYGLDQEIFQNNGTSNAKFGSSLSYDLFGSTAHLLVGVPLGNENTSVLDSGAAIVFASDGSPASWKQQARLALGTNAVAGDHVGTSVAIQGVFAALGAPLRKIDNHASAGAVEIFFRDDIFADSFEAP
jgi:FG-GAP repeat